MARRLEPQAAAAPAEVDSAGESLSPDLPITIAGRDLVVREYGFFEGLEVAHLASRFIADMHAICRDGSLRYDRIRRLFGVHKDVVVAIAARSAGVEPEWITGLGRADLESFFSAWFSVNAGFFVHEVVVEMREERRLLAAVTASGTPSSPGSAPPGSATSTASDGTPSASSGSSTTP